MNELRSLIFELSKNGMWANKKISIKIKKNTTIKDRLARHIVTYVKINQKNYY